MPETALAASPATLAAALGPPRPDALREEYERLRVAGLAALQAGDIAAALATYESMHACARRIGDASLVDLAFCNRAAVAITLGEVEEPIAGLREILLRSQNVENCAFAAYHIARAYELRKEFKKSLFYARIARDRAEQLGHPQRRASAYNQIGNALLAESLFEDAAASYRHALSLAPTELEHEQQGEAQLIYMANLGYCEVVLGRIRSGISRLYHVLRFARREGSRRLEMMARIDLCFANMERQRLARADRHGRRAYALAKEIGEVDELKNALYLLGEVAVLDDRLDDARTWFGELQRRFFPQQTKLADFLVGVDVRRVINLRA